MRTRYLFFYGLGVLALFPFQGRGQTSNAGILSIAPETAVWNVAEFLNLKEGAVYNDGTIHYQSDFNNEGFYGFSPQLQSSYAVFQQSAAQPVNQQLSGSAAARFYDVLFQNEGSKNAIDLRNDMSIGGTANFLQGVVQIDPLKGALVFESDSRAINASNKSFVAGEVEKIGRNNFVFPIGDQGVYRQAQISAPPGDKDSFSAQYHLENSDKKYPHRNKTGAIQRINDREYWTVTQNNTPGEVVLTLSWNAQTTPADLLEEAGLNWRILRWDTAQALWVDEGGIVDAAAQTVSTPTLVTAYGVFTLGLLKPDVLLEGDVVIYNAVSPDGDGINDYFQIDNIRRFPNNSVQVFNRWGVKVYETTAYDSSGNVFRGRSEGRVNVDKHEKLPTGTYYYIVNYEVVAAAGSQTIKKAGYLHLENN
ncbi:gliding motility-associated C-terminal domain-containing protein [Flavobacterium sp. JP2137]|uniref:gliding motility-associated C-terminal domain-containing protein n=1 Tax=Flavobacterium sp. JP2137 TaxID=3414510 RepID=UPI003D300925